MVRWARLQAYRYGALVEYQSVRSLRAAAITMAAWWSFLSQFDVDDDILRDYLTGEWRRGRSDVRTGEIDTRKLYAC